MTVEITDLGMSKKEGWHSPALFFCRLEFPPYPD